MRAGSERRAPVALEFLRSDRAGEHLDGAGALGHTLGKGHCKAASRFRDVKRPARRRMVAGRGGHDGRQREPDVAEEAPPVPFDEESGMVEVGADFAERADDAEVERDKQLVKGLDPGKARPTRPG